MHKFTELKPMKRIVVDIFKSKDPYSGLGQFSLQFAKQLLGNQTNFDIKLLAASNAIQTIDNKHLLKATWQQQFLPRFGKKYDLWHSLHQFPRHFPNGNTKQILTIHDLNFLIEKSPAKASKYLKRLQKNIDNASCLTTISHYSKNQIIKHLDIHNKPIHVIYNGVDDGNNIEPVKPLGVSEQQFFFSIGIFNKKKNFEVLLPMMKEFPTMHLYLAGNNNTTYGQFIKDEIIRLGLQSQVSLLGKISDEEKKWLYQHMTALLFPSLAEGFGMPVIEAMQYGKPVFLNQETSLPEIGGKHANYFKDFTCNTMVTTIKNGLSMFKQNPTIQKSLIEHAAQFTWENSIKQYLNLYRELLD